MARKNTLSAFVRFKIRLFTLASLVLISCSSTPSPLATSKTDFTSSPINTSTNHFSFGNYSSSAWVSDSFDGDRNRQFQGKALTFDVTQRATDGGFDVGLTRSDMPPLLVSEAKKNLKICSKYEIRLSGKGRWWAGPKISVNWQGDETAKESGDDWYENYIVEIASSSPDELHDIFMGDYFKGEELPNTALAGSSYRHYKIRFHSWWQFWSVRQSYRPSGSLPLEAIIDVWIQHGLPANRTFDGVKANIETYGEMDGSGRLYMDATNDSAKPLMCD